MDCFACRVATGDHVPQGGLVLDRQGFVAFHAEDVAVPGYLILLPRRHVEAVGALLDAEARVLGGLLAELARAVGALPQVERVYVASVGELVRHVHFHLLPRYEWMRRLAEGPRPDGFKLMEVVRRAYGTAEWLQRKETELRQTAERLRAALG